MKEHVDGAAEKRLTECPTLRTTSLGFEATIDIKPPENFVVIATAIKLDAG